MFLNRKIGLFFDAALGSDSASQMSKPDPKNRLAIPRRYFLHACAFVSVAGLTSRPAAFLIHQIEDLEAGLHNHGEQLGPFA